MLSTVEVAGITPTSDMEQLSTAEFGRMPGATEESNRR